MSRIDKRRIQFFLGDIRKNALEIGELLRTYKDDEITMKAIKFMLIEIREAMSNTLQHILARDRGVPVSGYIDTINKAKDLKIISDDLYRKIKPFFDFRNSLIHRYWLIDDKILLENLKDGYKDFDRFNDEIENYIRKIESQSVL